MKACIYGGEPYDYAAKVDGIVPGIRTQSTRFVYAILPYARLKLQILIFTQLLWDILGTNGFLGDHNF